MPAGKLKLKMLERNRHQMIKPSRTSRLSGNIPETTVAFSITFKKRLTGYTRPYITTISNFDG